MQTLLSILIIILMSLQLFVAGRIIDHDTFSVMVDDVDVSRERDPVPTLSSISPSTTPNQLTATSGPVAPTSNGLSAAPASVGITLNEPLSNSFGEMPSNSGANESSATSVLAAIRSTTNASNIQHKPAVAAEATGAKHSRGYLSNKSSRPVDKRQISIVEEDLLVVPMPNGGQAIAYDISAVDGSGHGFRTGMRSIPGLRPILPGNQPGLSPDTWLTFQDNNLANTQPEFSTRDQVHNLARMSSQDEENGFPKDMSSISDQTGNAGAVWPSILERTENAGNVWPSMSDRTENTGNVRPSMSDRTENTGNVWPSISDQTKNAGDVWRMTPSSIQGSGQDQGSTLAGPDGRHFVHLPDDFPLNSDQDQDRGERQNQHHEGSGELKDQHHKGSGEHKKHERRQPIRKHAEEWRCLEVGVGAGDKVEKLVCPPGLMITSIGLASLGNPEGTCSGQGSRQPGSCHLDLSATLQSRCTGKSVCDIDTIRAADVQHHCPDYTGDSRSVIEYQCSPWVSKPTAGNSTLERCQQVLNNGSLSCPMGQAILGFGFGFAGEIDGSCAKGISPGICSRNVMTDLTTQCVGRNQCRVDMNSKQFGSACSNSTAPLSLAASFKCGSLADGVSNSTKLGNQSYTSSNLHFAKGNGAEVKQSLIGAVVTTMAMIFVMI